MRFIPYTWIKICSLRTEFKKINSLLTVLVLSFLLFPIISSACTVSCKSSLNVSLDGDGQALITPLILLQDPSCDPNNFSVNITTPNGVSVGNTLTCAHVGLVMTATVTQISNGNNCSTLINVSDFINPQIVCSDTIVLCNQSVDPFDIGFPLATDNCSVFANIDLDYVDEFMDLGCFAVHGSDTITSQIQRTWSVQDESGNIGTCIQMIYLKRVTIDDVVFPAHQDGFAAPALDCNQDPTDLSLTGEPSVEGAKIDNSGNCELIVSFSDQIVPLCGTGSYRVLRTWTIIDYCSGDFTLNVQIINVVDTTAPLLNCPNDITVNTQQNDCSGTVNLPFGSATDDCSTVLITPNWAFGTGYGPFLDIPVGTHTVTYTAEDDCGNISTCTMNVTIQDNVPPTPICDYTLVVDLSVFGNAIVFANSFDDGSYDNCGIDSMAVSRDGINFQNSTEFDCNDIENSPIEVVLKIWDLAGNFNECAVNVIIDDKINPAILCPSDANISCYEDYTDLSIVGEPIVEDNCLVDTVFYTDSINFNDCNEGIVLRLWTVEDLYGNINTCTQTITLQDNTPLSIIWPEDYITSACNPVLADSITGTPIFINDDCESISFNYSDQTIPLSPSCFKILRIWSVYEWCSYDPNSGTNEGYWTYIQEIDVLDLEAPVFECASDTTINMFAANCEGVYVNITLPVAIDCNPNVMITNDGVYADSNGADASGFYPPGTHTINYTATDGCGNNSTCTQNITIVDGKAPTAICLGSISMNIGLDGGLVIDPTMINLESYDNCSASENLIMTVSPNFFTCDDLGNQTVTLTVTDEAGNSSSCTSVINIQNNNNVCNEPSAVISGVIENENGVAIQLVDVMINGDLQDTISNDFTGYFEFQELPLGGDYDVKPYKNINPLNGVSTFDLVFIQRHVLDIQSLSSPYKMIAADINKSGNISTIDIVRLRRLVLGIDTAFVGNTAWRFLDADYVFPNPSNPFEFSFPESLNYNNLEEDELSADFIAIKIGDVNISANPSELINGEIRNEESTFDLSTPDITIEQGTFVEVPIYTNTIDELLGYQLTFDFDQSALEFIDIEGEMLQNANDDYFNFNKISEGLISTSWTSANAKTVDLDKPLFILKFKVLNSGRLKKYFEINSNLLHAEAYNGAFEILGINFEFSSPEIEEKEQFMLYDNYPNPFDGITKFPFYLPDATEVRFEVIDPKGTVVQVFEIYYTAGHHEMILTKNDFGSSGLYYFKMIIPNGEIMTKAVFVK